MQRRQLLQLMGLSSLTSLCPPAWSAISSKANSDKLWLVMYANNGWDPVSFCNPRSGDYVTTNSQGVSNSRGRMSGYPDTFIQKLGAFEYAPGLTPTADPAFGRFIEKYQQSLLIINGVEMGTNGHQEGRVKAVSGILSSVYPCFAAYAAAATPDAQIPLPFLASGEPYNNTGNLTARIALEGVQYVNELANTRQFVSEGIAAELEKAELDNIQQQLTDGTLPRLQQELHAFNDAQLNRRQLKSLKAKLPTTYNADGILARMQDICASMAAGLTVSAQLAIGRSFDTHANHDAAHANSLNYFFNSMDFLIQEAERQGIRERLNIIMLSDFGRTPYYNGNNGKDHWSTGSMLFMGPDFTGNRMIQGSDALVRSQKLNMQTFLPDDKGQVITAEMINRTLRTLTVGIDSSLDQRFVISAPAVPALFTG